MLLDQLLNGNLKNRSIENDLNNILSSSQAHNLKSIDKCFPNSNTHVKFHFCYNWYAFYGSSAIVYFSWKLCPIDTFFVSLYYFMLFMKLVCCVQDERKCKFLYIYIYCFKYKTVEQCNCMRVFIHIKTDQIQTFCVLFSPILKQFP